MLLLMVFLLYLWLSDISLYTYMTVKNIETYYFTIALTQYLMISFIFHCFYFLLYYISMCVSMLLKYYHLSVELP